MLNIFICRGNWSDNYPKTRRKAHRLLHLQFCCHEPVILNVTRADGPLSKTFTNIGFYCSFDPFFEEKKFSKNEIFRTFFEHFQTNFRDLPEPDNYYQSCF